MAFVASSRLHTESILERRKALFFLTLIEDFTLSRVPVKMSRSDDIFVRINIKDLSNLDRLCVGKKQQNADHRLDSRLLSRNPHRRAVTAPEFIMINAPRTHLLCRRFSIRKLKNQSTIL
jgi:hypothetical protein